MDALGIVHIFQEASNLSVDICKVNVLGEIYLLFFYRSHQSLCISVLFWFALSRHTDLNLILLQQGDILVSCILHALVAVMDHARGLSLRRRRLQRLQHELGALDAARGAHPVYDRFCAALKERLADASGSEPSGRRLTQDLALAVQASLLARQAPAIVSDAFCASRLQSDLGGVFGTLAPDTPFDALLERAMPAPAPRP